MYARFSTSKFTKVSSGGPTARREHKGMGEQSFSFMVKIEKSLHTDRIRKPWHQGYHARKTEVQAA